MNTTKKAAIIGGGVIGGAWAARFALMGWDVAVFDPDPQAERKLSEVMENARAALPGLSDTALPSEGAVTLCNTLKETVADADWVQESVPERIELKQAVYRDIQELAGPDTVIGSSTSGFKPSELAEAALHPQSIIVTHPFNPVYLLPLVEVVPHPGTDSSLLASAMEVLRSIGMYPLHVRAEIDAHIADRFLEAVWREALWLVRDGVATTEEIDEAIRMGFGLRWAQMGLFETYRVAGGEAGMAHFIAQFGPALKWPWTRLMDVPELTDDLVETIATQSDDQAQGRSIRDLERIRDANLVAILRGLKAQDWGAGAVLKAQDARLETLPHTIAEVDPSRPIPTAARAIPLDWTDYNGHMNEARYLQAFGDATDRFMEIIGCDAAYIASGGSYFTAETHIRHLDEARAGQRIRIETLCLEGAGKKLRLFHSMFEGDRLLATGEHMLIHVSLETRRASDPSKAIATNLELVATAHAALGTPVGAGAAVGKR